MLTYAGVLKTLPCDTIVLDYALTYADVCGHMLTYADVLKTLPRDTIVLDWGYEASHPFAYRGVCVCTCVCVRHVRGVQEACKKLIFRD